VLQQVPGLNIVQTGGPGGQTSVFMRGTNSNHTKVLIDGIDVSDPSNPAGSFDFGQLLTAGLARVEVLRGPQSGLYGSDAIGGVISIITQSGEGPAHVDATVEGGSFDTFNQAVTLLGSDGGFHYAATVEHLHAGATPVTPLNLLNPGEKRNDDYDDNVGASTKLGLDLTDTLDVGLVARETSTHLRFTGDSFDPVTFAYLGPDATQSETDVMETDSRVFVHEVAFAGALEQTLGVDDTRKRSANYGNDGGLASVDLGQRTTIDWRGIIKAARDVTVVLGAQHERDQIDVVLEDPVSASDTLNSGYAELQTRLGAFAAALNVRYDDQSRFGGHTTYRFAPVYVIAATGTQLKASIGTGFKAPTLSELFQNEPEFFFFANPDLKPEESTGFDAGFEQDLGGTARFGATWYHNQLHNLIDSNATFTSFANVDRATTQGLESFLTWDPLPPVSLRLDYTYTEATNDILDQELERRPKHKGSLSARWQATHALSVTASVLTLGGFLDINRAGSMQLNAPGYTTVNLAVSYDLTRQLRLLARVNNLFDRQYQNPTGFLGPSLGAYGGIEVRL
jgi:vitamin B12 transporter